MNRGRYHRIKWALLPVLWLLLGGGYVPAWGGERTFPVGSLVIPVDPCWQPAQVQPAWSGCAGGGSSAAIAGAYGLAYHLQQLGIPVYQGGGAGDEDLAFVIHGQGEAPVVEHPGGQVLTPPARVTPEGQLPGNLFDYRDKPFLVDSRDLTPEALTLLAEAPLVRRHEVLVPFIAPVVRQLVGLPRRLVVEADVAAVQVREILALAGLGGSDGVSVVTEADADTPTAVLACVADIPPAAPQTGPCGLAAIFTALSAVPTTATSQETVQVAPVISAGTLYVASNSFPGRAGHLRAFALNSNGRNELWDAADGIPGPGGAVRPCPPDDALLPPFADSGCERLLFTNAGVDQHFRLLRFDACAAAALTLQLGSVTAEHAATLIDTVRSGRFGAITRSTPAVVGDSPFVSGGLQRDRVVYVGSDAGLLHAILAGSPAAGAGRELWGYLPGSLLAMLSRQPWGDATAFATVRVDGSPAVSDQFADFDGDGRREWRTVLVGTASADGLAGVLFALDVTDPYLPQLLWEKQLTDLDLGASRGVAMTVPGSDGTRLPRVFLTGAPLQRRDAAGGSAPYAGQYGVLACAFNLVDGTRLWDFFAPYEGSAANLNAPPAPPTLMNSDGRLQGVLFGDLAGRLWALDPASGQPFGGGPVYQLPGGSSTPIAAGVALSGGTVLFASGGAEHVDPTVPQTLYAIELQAASARLLWSVPLAVGEQPRGAPLLDRAGRIYVALSAPSADSGRLLVMNADGTPAGTASLTGAPGESLALAAGLVITVTRQGTIEQLGTWREPAAPEQSVGKVRILSWRFR